MADPSPVVFDASRGSHPRSTVQATPVPQSGRFPSAPFRFVSPDAPVPTPPPTSGDTLADRVRALAEEAAADTDLFVVDVDVRGFQGSRVVSVYADAESGAGADDLATLSRSLSFLLDTEDLVKGRYRLDVSTPGADRPLTDRRQYAHHAGRALAVEMSDGDVVKGTLQSVSDAAVVLDGHDPIPFDSIREARVLLPW